MIVLDTHTWIWWLTLPEKLSRRAEMAIQRAEQSSAIGVSAITCWEIAMLVAKNRLKFSMDVEVWIEKGLNIPKVKLLELSPKIAVEATRLAGSPPSDPVDQILIATAKVHRCPLITKDQSILAYPSIESIW